MIGIFGLRQRSPEVAIGNGSLTPMNQQHLSETADHRPVLGGIVVPTHLAQTGHLVVRHLREDLVFLFLVHVSAGGAAGRVHADGPTVPPVVEEVVGPPAMLKPATDHHVSNPIGPRQTDQQHRSPTKEDQRSGDGGGADGQPDACGPDGFWAKIPFQMLDLIRQDSSCPVCENAPDPVDHAEVAD